TPVANAAGSEAPGAMPAPPLIVEAVKGTVETRVEHELRWTAGGGNGARLGEASAKGWQAVSKIRVTPNRTSVDRLDVRIPRDYIFDKEVGATSNNAGIDDVVIDATNGLVQIKLQKQSRPFTDSLPAFYSAVAGTQQGYAEFTRADES